MKFSEFTYVRPEKQEFVAELNIRLERLNAAEQFAEADAAVADFCAYITEWDSGYVIAQARMMADTTDQAAKQEMDRYNELLAVYYEAAARFYAALLESKFRPELEASWGRQLFQLAEQSRKIASPDVTEELQRESAIGQAYTRLIASARIPFAGAERNLSALEPFQKGADREVRKQAWDARYAFFAEKEAEMDDLFDQLIKLRTRIAHKLGFANFVELGYARNNRIGYDAAHVARFREQVATRVVPLMVKLKEQQRARLGVDVLRYYDDDVLFPTGEPTAKGDLTWVVEQAQRMFHEMSPETGQFFQMMTERELMDLDMRPSKASAGYCNVIPTYQVPYLYTCMNGTAGAISVLTHEAGHAFQVYETMKVLDRPLLDYYFPTHDGAEIFSMTMEYFAWPWMQQFFAEETEKFQYLHVVRDVRLLLWVAMVDEFQHHVYERPEMTPQERKTVWRGLEQKYMPYLNHAGCDYLERGGMWQKQQHVFRFPFYYIDYALAAIVAIQFWQRANDDRQAAWDSYLQIARFGGSKSFLELVELANCTSPFAEDCLDTLVADMEMWLDRVQASVV